LERADYRAERQAHFTELEAIGRRYARQRRRLAKEQGYESRCRRHGIGLHRIFAALRDETIDAGVFPTTFPAASRRVVLAGTFDHLKRGLENDAFLWKIYAVRHLAALAMEKLAPTCRRARSLHLHALRCFPSRFIASGNKRLAQSHKTAESPNFHCRHYTLDGRFISTAGRLSDFLRKHLR